MVHLGVAIQQRDGRCVLPKQYPYKAVPGWFEDYERKRDAGKFIERQHGSLDGKIFGSELTIGCVAGYWDDPPPLPEEVPLPEMDAFGL